MENKANHCVYNINYHIVFCPKYRRKVINGKVEETIKQTVGKICESYGFSLIQMETMPDHLHIFLSAPPTVAPAEIVKTLKSITANTVFKTIPGIKKRYFWGSGLWSRGYYIGTAGNVSAETIRRYIENQKGGEQHIPLQRGKESKSLKPHID